MVRNDMRDYYDKMENINSAIREKDVILEDEDILNEIRDIFERLEKKSPDLGEGADLT